MEPIYTPCYCEENVWNLAKKFSSDVSRRAFVIFISNKKKSVVIFEQKSSSVDLGYVVWDYHVIYVRENSESVLEVHDLDSKLPTPCKLVEYLHRAFPDPSSLKRHLRPMFRVIKAEDFLRDFASDRSHMIQNDAWLMPPPPYPCIRTEGEQELSI
jgi:hypothetical protein